MSRIYISKIEWGKISIGTMADPDATIPSQGVAIVDDGGLYFTFQLSQDDSIAIDAVLQQAARREIQRRLTAIIA